MRDHVRMLLGSVRIGENPPYGRLIRLRNVMPNERLQLGISSAAWALCTGRSCCGRLRGAVLDQERRHAQRALASRNKAGGGRGGRRALGRKAAC